MTSIFANNCIGYPYIMIYLFILLLVKKCI